MNGCLSYHAPNSMQAALRCAAQHFVYSSITGGFMKESGA